MEAFLDTPEKKYATVRVGCPFFGSQVTEGWLFPSHSKVCLLVSDCQTPLTKAGFASSESLTGAGLDIDTLLPFGGVSRIGVELAVLVGAGPLGLTKSGIAGRCFGSDVIQCHMRFSRLSIGTSMMSAGELTILCTAFFLTCFFLEAFFKPAMPPVLSEDL